MHPLQADPGNAEWPWDEFDPEWYVSHNYRSPRPDDRLIVQHVREFFAATDPGHPISGVDVGSGANLYPALAMLPFCAEIELWEHSSANVAWLQHEIQTYSPSWDPFWAELQERSPYTQIDDPRADLRSKATVHQRDLFQAPDRQFGIGTMFFVAESITAKQDEFADAVHRFVRLLRPDAPFAAAFMKNSTGYTVGDQRFPAVAIAEPHIKSVLEGLGCEVAGYTSIPLVNPIRDGYDGMILALGKAPDPEMHDSR